MMTFLHGALVVAALFLVAGTILNFSKHPHWFIRAWDFPRVFVAAVSAVVALCLGFFFRGSAWDVTLIAALVAVIVRQLYMIFPYTSISPESVKQTRKGPGDHRFTLIMSNVLMENQEYEKWLKTIRKSDPDIIVAVEVDEKWNSAIDELKEDYPVNVRCPLDNYYGMVLFSRLQFEGEAEVRYLVQDDIPSIHATVILKDGQKVRLHALHPRPPEPIYDQDSAPRDAELVIMGREIAEKERTIPTIACGDLNDVAWSFTTQLFIRISKLLDPRKGRGLYNSFNANSHIFRYPLDHVFHSNEFKLVRLEVLDHVGSDHFPMLIELSCEPEASAEQKEPQAEAGDQESATELVQEQAKRELEGKEEGHVAEEQGVVK